MTAQPFKTIVLDLLQQGHRDKEAFLQELSETEQNAIGTPNLWSAKDHMAHRAFWHRDFVRRLTAIQQHQEIPESEEDEDQLNSRNFEEHRLRPFSEILAESERVNTELITLIEQLSEEDLTAPGRFPSISGERSLYTSFLGGCYEHDQEHLAQYYFDHHNFPRAIEIREKCASRIIEAEVPEWVKGSFLYNLACFYTQSNQLEKAAALLQEAFRLAPRLKERAKSDSELVALRDQLKSENL
jgi:tetratricopeptide (TPR) repeat protein